MSAETLLARLDHVREIRSGQWRAKCPAHDGKSDGSLSIAETDDRTTLLRCFGGCDAQAVVEAVGLGLKDLFPPSRLKRDERRDYARQASKREARLVLRHELFVLQQCNDAHLERWPVIDPHPEGRERLAVERVRKTLGAIYG